LWRICENYKLFAPDACPAGFLPVPNIEPYPDD